MKELTEVIKRIEARPSERPEWEPSICSDLIVCESWPRVMNLSCVLGANAWMSNAGSRQAIPSQTVYECCRSLAAFGACQDCIGVGHTNQFSVSGYSSGDGQ
jgi:hypothetical protein